MAMKPIVTLPHELVQNSNEYGARVIASYASGANAASRAVSSHGADGDASLQAHARMAECAFCIHIGLDPSAVLDWSGRWSDPGWDVLAFGVRWDVKATRNGHFLIWPINKRHLFEVKRFEALVLVRGDAPVFTMAGFIIKSFFAHAHRIAGIDHCLDAGTWYMDENQLWPIK